MLLNPEKTVTINFLINYRHVYGQVVVLGNDVSIFPSKEVKFLGVTLDDHSTFSSHVDNIVSSCISKLYLLRQFKKLSINSDGLKRFCTANICSIISYVAPAWFSILSDFDKGRLERVQRSATRTNLPDLSYEELLSLLTLPTISDFIWDISANHFWKIADDPTHPLFNYIQHNTCRMSSLKPTVYRPELCRTTKCAKTFFQIFISFFNK